ncbi:Pkinase-domain-containing protein [Erysiphe pulchra]|uniref:non-specific serine/threonine protein kinase n=1 Tax=Erysiphe pulchra TaxID=225359 RepID=A0A2S4PNZ5_9PEZI|nr:Pkinase-domain-containing protein [Erysiphe pulchra]
MNRSKRLSLPNNYQANESSKLPFDESNWHKPNEKYYNDRTNYMSSGAQARDSNKSVSVAQLVSQRLSNFLQRSPKLGSFIKNDCQGDTAIQPEKTPVTEAGHQEYYNQHNYSPSLRNTPLPPNVYARGSIGSHLALGTNNLNGTPSPYNLEGSIASNSEEWKDRGAAVGLREDYDANGKFVLRQVKKGVRDFEFGRILGEGSYSQVVLGRDRQTSKEYAIKILDKKHIIKEKKVKYVNIEKDTLNRLIEHPGIVRLYYTFQDSTSLYYVLDVASGGELLGVLKRNGLFSEECTRFYGAQILDAIEHMHNRGVIHRDLKPENLLVDDQMHIKITDFGTAKLLPDPRKNQASLAGCDASFDTEESMRAKSFVGTAEYVSPELLTEKSACKASDLWAFGCIIFQLLAGRPPFKAGNDYQTFQKIVNLEYEFPPGFPRLAKDLVERLLVLDPQKRLTIEHIKSHPFFHGIQWGRGLWKQKAPRLKPYIPPPQELSI